MASSKDVELILKTRLDQGDAVTSANSIGKNIADTLEKAFDGMGSRIAESLMKEIQEKLGSLNLLGGSSGPSFITDRSGAADITPLDPSQTAFHGSEFATKTLNGINRDAERSINNNIPDPARVTRDSQHGPYRSYNPEQSFGYGALGKLSEQSLSSSSLLKRYGVSSYNEHIEDFREANAGTILSADSTVNKVKAYEQLRQLGGTEKFSNFASQKELDEATSTAAGVATDASKSIVSLENSILALQKSIIGLDKSMAQETDVNKLILLKDDKESQQARLGTLVSERAKTNDTLADASSTAKTLQSMGGNTRRDGFSVDAMGLRSGIAVAGGVGMALQQYSQLDIRKAQAAAGASDLRNFSGRDVASLDYDRIIATDMLGGEAAMKKEARSNVMDRTSGGLISGLAEMAGGAAFGLATGGAGWIPAAAAMKDGYSRVTEAQMGYLNFDANTAQEMRTKQALKIEENQDVMKLGAKGREVYRQSQQSALGIGDNKLSTWLTSRGEGNLVNFGMNSANLDEGTVRSGMRQFAAQTMASPAELESMQSQYKESLVLQGKGFSGATDTLANFQIGGNENAANDLYKSLIGSGMDKQQANRLAESSGQIAASGMNMAGSAKDFGMTVGAKAQELGVTSKAGMDVLARTEMEIRNKAVSGDGLAAIARSREIDKLEKERQKTDPKFKISDTDKLNMMKNTVDGKFYAKVMGIDTSGMSEEAIDNLGNNFEKESQKSRRDMLDSVGGGAGFAEMLDMGPQANASTADLKLKAIQSNATLKVDEATKKAAGDIEKPTTPEGKFAGFENGVAAAQVAASFQSMDSLMPKLNENLEKMVKHMQNINKEAADGSKLKDYNLPKPKTFVPGFSDDLNNKMLNDYENANNNKTARVAKPAGSIA